MTTKTVTNNVIVTTTVTQKFTLTVVSTKTTTIVGTATVTLKSSRIVIDGHDSDWIDIQPLLTEPERDLSRDNLELGVADIKQVFVVHDDTNLYFLVKFWDPVNFNVSPEQGEILTSLYVNIYVKERLNQF